MAKIPKLTASLPFGRRARDTGGARMDLLLPRDWPQTSMPIAWRLQRSGDVQTGNGSLEEVPHVGSTPVRVWTPATETLLTQTTLPTSSRAKVAQALPFALEEQLLDDPANLHFAWRRENDGALYVAVTAKERIRTWVTTLEKAGFKPATLCPATLVVPWSPGCWSAAFVGDELLVRTGPVSGFTCAGTISEPAALLVSNLRETPHVPEYFIVFKPPAEFRADTWSSALALPVRVEPNTYWDVPGDSTPALNLLQGDFAPAGEMGQQLRPWLPAAGMLALFLAGTIIFDGIEWWRLHRQHDAHTREMTSLLMSAFPETKTVLDPAQQMQKSLEVLQGRSGMRSHDMLPLLARAARAWATEPRARLKSLRYNERSLTLEVTAADTPTLERFRQALQSGGLQADMLATTPRAGEVEGRVRVKPPSTVSSAKP